MLIRVSIERSVSAALLMDRYVFSTRFFRAGFVEEEGRMVATHELTVSSTLITLHRLHYPS